MSQIPRFHRLAVNDLRREAADAVSLTFAIPQELADDYRFAPGQYLTLRTTMDVYTQAVAPAKHAAQAAVLALFFPITMSEDEEVIVGTA